MGDIGLINGESDVINGKRKVSSSWNAVHMENSSGSSEMIFHFPVYLICILSLNSLSLHMTSPRQFIKNVSAVV